MGACFSIFPKFYQGYSLDDLVELVHEVGLDTCNLVVRDGYWCEAASLKKDASRFVERFAGAGMKVNFATAACYAPRKLVEDSSPLKTLADVGIRYARIEYFRNEQVNVRAALKRANQTLRQLGDVAARSGVKVVIQLHQGTLLPSPSAVYGVLEGVNPEGVGVMLDPGNQTYEGTESYARSVSLLGEYLCSVGVKDAAWEPDEAQASGWGLKWVPVGEGVADWPSACVALKAGGFDGTFVFMPFYCQHDREQMTRKLKEEVGRLRQWWNQRKD